MHSPNDSRALEKHRGPYHLVYDLQVRLRECLLRGHQVVYDYDGIIHIRWKNHKWSNMDPMIGLARITSHDLGRPAFMYTRIPLMHPDRTERFARFRGLRYGLPEEVAGFRLTGLSQDRIDVNTVNGQPATVEQIKAKIDEAKQTLHRIDENP